VANPRRKNGADVAAVAGQNVVGSAVEGGRAAVSPRSTRTKDGEGLRGERLGRDSCADATVEEHVSGSCAAGTVDVDEVGTML